MRLKIVKGVSTKHDDEGRLKGVDNVCGSLTRLMVANDSICEFDNLPYNNMAMIDMFILELHLVKWMMT
jgi:hypothetical protein